MGLGLLLTAKPTTVSNEELLSRVEHWARARFVGGEAVSATDLAVSMALHPTAEPVEVSLCGPGTLAASAKTSTTGPGYHAYVVELLDNLAEALGLEWLPMDEDGEPGDDTGYFTSRDYAALQQEMLEWLRSFAGWLTSRDVTSMDVCMSVDCHYLYEAYTRTPLGPRDLAYWKRIAANPQEGTDFFAWWERGQGAAYHVGVALALMWSNVRWREPYTDQEEALLTRVADSLNAAYAADPSGVYPWREWAEVLGFLGRSHEMPIVQERAASERGPLVGYRRRDVRVSLVGGWTIELPGDFAEEYEDGTFHAWCGDRVVWFSAFRNLGANDVLERERRSAEKEPGTEILERHEEELHGIGTLKRAHDDGNESWQLMSYVAVRNRLGLLTVCYDDEEDRVWAEETWRSLQLPPDPTETRV